MHIPNTFDNFEQKLLQRGLETKSTTEYKGYLIVLRCYPISGISAKIIKVDSNTGKKYILREKAYNFRIPIEFLNEQKDYIDNYEINLINKFNKKQKL